MGILDVPEHLHRNRQCDTVQKMHPTWSLHRLTMPRWLPRVCFCFFGKSFLGFITIYMTRERSPQWRLGWLIRPLGRSSPFLDSIHTSSDLNLLRTNIVFQKLRPPLAVPDMPARSDMNRVLYPPSSQLHLSLSILPYFLSKCLNGALSV